MGQKVVPSHYNSVDMHLCVRQFFVMAIPSNSLSVCICVYVFVSVTSIVRNYLRSIVQVRYFELCFCVACVIVVGTVVVVFVVIIIVMVL